MTDAPNDTGMVSDVPATTTPSTRRTRRLTVIGALALVLVAGAVLVGAKASGARSGSLTQVPIGVKCVTPGLTNGVFPITVTFPSDGTKHTVLYYDGSDGGHYYPLGSTTSGTFTSSTSTDALYNTLIKVTWAPVNYDDTKYDSATCTRS